MGGKFKSADEVISTGKSEAWNVAQGYVHIKILRLLIQLDRYDTIAQFGTEDMDLDGGMDLTTINKKRIEGIQRFISTLKQLASNVFFSIKSEDRPKVNAFISRIKNVEEVMPNLFSEQEDQRDHSRTLIIDEELFFKCLRILQDIKEKINTPINKAGLIFRESDDMDLDKIMEEIIQGG